MSSAETLLGHVIGDYQLKQVLGEGAANVVFLGESITSPQELVAVKILLPPPSLSIYEIIECRRRFTHEILTLRERLHHPSILPILALSDVPSTRYSYLVVPYISGGSLGDRLTGGKLPLSKISHYVMQVAEALDYIHSQQVIHCNLKPANILVDEEDHIYLMDFGIDKPFDSALTQISQSGQMVGTLRIYGSRTGVGRAGEWCNGYLWVSGPDVYIDDRTITLSASIDGIDVTASGDHPSHPSTNILLRFTRASGGRALACAQQRPD